MHWGRTGAESDQGHEVRLASTLHILYVQQGFREMSWPEEQNKMCDLGNSRWRHTVRERKVWRLTPRSLSWVTVTETRKKRQITKEMQRAWFQYACSPPLPEYLCLSLCWSKSSIGFIISPSYHLNKSLPWTNCSSFLYFPKFKLTWYCIYELTYIVYCEISVRLFYIYRGISCLSFLLVSMVHMA